MPSMPETSASPGGRDAGISIIVATVGRPDDLRWLAGSISCQTSLPRQVIVVDASDLPTFHKNAQALAVLDELIHVEHVSATPNLTQQRNIGVERATESLILFLDDDVVLGPSYIQGIIEAFDRYPLALGLTGRILLERPPNRVSGRLRRLAGFRDFRSGKPTWSGEVAYVMQPDKDEELYVLPGCNMAYRREVFDVLGLRFDVSLSGYALAEDYIFSSQVRRFGSLIQLTTPTLFHNSTQAARWSEEYAGSQIVNVARLARLTRRQFGVRAGCVEIRIGLRGLRSVARMALSGDAGAAWRILKLTCTTVTDRGPVHLRPRPNSTV